MILQRANIALDELEAILVIAFAVSRRQRQTGELRETLQRRQTLARLRSEIALDADIADERFETAAAPPHLRWSPEDLLVDAIDVNADPLQDVGGPVDDRL